MKLKENEISDSKFKIDHCAFHLEGRLTESGFKVIEIAARPAGGFITSHLIRLSSGHSFIEKSLMLLLEIMLKIAGQIMKMVIKIMLL